MLHPVAAKLAFSLGKRMGRSNGGHDPSRSVQVGNPMPNGEFRCPENTGADRQLPRIILGTTKRTRGSGAAQPPARSRL